MHNSAAQRHRLNRAINYARSNFAEELDLATMADAACFSKHHFSRVFTSHFSETPFELLTRIRLERSTHNLVYFRDKPITDVAFDCGFSSLQSFSRAFNHRFGISPRSFRSANRWSFHRFPNTRETVTSALRPAQTEPQARAVLAPVRIEERPAVRLAYIRHIGPYFNIEGGIERAFRALIDWAMRTGVWQDDSVLMGLCPDHPAVTPARHCLYDACVTVADDVPEDNVVSIQTVPAGTYAVLNVQCESHLISGIWEWFTLRWAAGQRPQAGVGDAL